MKPSFILLQFLLSSFLAVVSADYGPAILFHPLHKLKLRGKKVDTQLPEEVTTYSPVYVGNQVGLAELDKIESLPGQPEGVDFDQYSGYVTVDPAAGRALFYYLTEATEDADTKPLVLWLNGGPGASSFGYGAMMELGPFRVNTDGKTLSRNDYAWNKVANILFLESPAGVGFSYSNTTSDYDKNGDTRTALDSYTFLVNWLQRFPKYKTRDLYITGESYAGHYVPQLSYTILQNKNITNQTVINLRGIAIGNALIDEETTNTGLIDFQWSHALISDEVYDGIIMNCNFSSEAEISDICVAYLHKVDTGNISVYDIYAPLCKGPSSKPSLGGFDPCSGQYISAYLNLPEVQKALHANLTSLPYPWTSWSSLVNEWGDRPLTILPIIEKLWQNNLRVWIYSGDTDNVIPTTCSRYAINKFKLTVNISWYPWYTDKEVGGFAIGYEKLSFVTVRGSGHFVPSYQPARALTLFSSFLAGRLPPRS